MPTPVISDTYQRILTATDVERALQAHLLLWLPDYLAEMERQQGRTAGSVPMPQSVQVSAEFDRWPEQQLPALVIVSPGMADGGARQGERGRIRAAWHVTCAMVVSARTRGETDGLAKLYAAAIRAAVMQHASLGNFARGVTLTTEQYDTISSDDARTLIGASVVFEVEVDNVLSRLAGPPQAPSTPYPAPANDPVVPDKAHVHLDLNPNAIT